MEVLMHLSPMQSVLPVHLGMAASSCVSAWTMLPVTMWLGRATAAQDTKASAVIKVRADREDWAMPLVYLCDADVYTALNDQSSVFSL